MKNLYVKYLHPAGQDHEVELFKKAEQMNFLERGHMYQVQKLKMGAFSTKISLVNVPGPFTELNSVAFDFYITKDGQLQKHDIFSDPEYNPALGR